MALSNLFDFFYLINAITAKIWTLALFFPPNSVAPSSNYFIVYYDSKVENSCAFASDKRLIYI